MIQSILKRIQFKTVFSKYWFVILVGAFWVLASIYHNCGENRHVLWNTYIKTIRELFWLIILIKVKSKLENYLSILFWFGFAAYSLALMLNRYYCAIKSNLVYDAYYELMKSDMLSLCLTFIIFAILVLIKYLNRK